MNKNSKRKIDEAAHRYAMNQLSRREAGMVGLGPIAIFAMLAMLAYFVWGLL